MCGVYGEQDPCRSVDVGKANTELTCFRDSQRRVSHHASVYMTSSATVQLPITQYPFAISDVIQRYLLLSGAVLAQRGQRPDY